MQSKASRNQLNLPHGTKTKPEMQKNSEQPESTTEITIIIASLEYQ